MDTKMMTAGIIIIGDEILNGNVTDTISSFLCQRFHAVGIDTRKITTVPDDIKMISEEVRIFSKSFDIVITTGGLGPTHDDVTYEALAISFQTTLHKNEEMEKFYSYYLKNEDSSSTNMITIPSNAEVIIVDLEVPLEGSLAKFPIVKTKNVFSFPGIPSYTKSIFAAMEMKYFQNAGHLFFSRIIYLNVDEIRVLPMLNEAVAEYENRVKFGCYPLVDYVQKHGEQTKIYVESSSLDDCLDAESALLLKIPPHWRANVKSGGPNYEIIQRLMVSGIPLAATLRTSFQILEKCFDEYDISETFICFNGGKDCTVLVNLIYYYCMTKKIHHNLKLVYFHDPDSFLEIDSFIEEVKNKYEVDLCSYPVPMKKSLYEFLAKEPTRRVCFLGQRSSDPRSKNLKPMQETDTNWPKLMRIFPLLHWSYKDIWDFIRCANIPYCSLYDRGYTSLGMKSETNINQRLKFVDSDNVAYYRPAFLLSADECERDGRLNHNGDIVAET